MAHLAAPSGLFVAAEGQRRIEDIEAVDPDGYDTEGAQGAALAAGVGMGLYATPADAFVGIEPLFTVEPDDRSRSAYAHLNERWQAALRRALQ